MLFFCPARTPAAGKFSCVISVKFIRVNKFEICEGDGLDGSRCIGVDAELGSLQDYVRHPKFQIVRELLEVAPNSLHPFAISGGSNEFIAAQPILFGLSFNTREKRKRKEKKIKAPFVETL